jgi:hypothetical protein
MRNQRKKESVGCLERFQHRHPATTFRAIRHWPDQLWARDARQEFGDLSEMIPGAARAFTLRNVRIASRRVLPARVRLSPSYHSCPPETG